MLTNLVLSVVLPASPPLELKASSASLFKNGYAVVVREAPLKAGGEYTIEEFPAAVLGTLWITASPGVRLREVVATSVETESETDAGTLEEVLSANVGKRLTFWLHGRGGQTGVLKSAAGAILVIDRSTAGSKPDAWVLPKASVAEISDDAGALVWKIKRKAAKRVIRLTAEAPAAGKLYVVSLERGMTWAPAYSVDISDARKLHLVSKATILNDLTDLDGIEVRLVTGFPNIPFIGYSDPFAVAQSVDQYVSGLMRMGTPDELRREGAKMMMGQALAPGRGFDAAFEPSGLPGFQAEDLFFYRQPKVRLKKGDRGYFVLFAADSEYEHVYEWDIPDRIADTSYQTPDDRPGDVWHSLKFNNTSGQPLTTAPATTFKSGEILGQDMISYTSAGAETLLKITKALDVRAEDAEEETQREPNATSIKGSRYDLVTLKGTLRIHNRKADGIKLKIVKFLTGEVISADGNPKSTKLARGLRAVNPRQRLEWLIALKPGEKKELTYTYKVYVSS